MSLLILLWTLTKAQSHSLPRREAEGEEAGGGVAGEEGEVSYQIITYRHEYEMKIEAERNK